MEQKQFIEEVLPLREKLYRHAQRMLQDTEEAEDITQEVFCKLWFMRNKLDGYDNITGLSMMITKNLCINRIKVLQRNTDNAEETLYNNCTEHTPHSQLEHKDDVKMAMKIIDGLPPLQRLIIQMKHMEGYEVEEIAAIIGCKPEAVRMNLSRARKKVKNYFFKNER